MTGSAVPVTVALPPYHHTAEIAARTVPLAGMAPTFVDMSSASPDVVDLPLLEYVTRRLSGDDELIAIPAFPARAFVHSWIHVAEHALDASEPNATAAVYARGLLVDRAGPAVPPERVIVAPGAAVAGLRGLRPLFEDAGEPARADYARTGVYPILSVIALRAELVARERWLASNLYRAFEIARRRYLARLRDIRGSRVPIPSVAGHVRMLEGVFGPDLGPYGMQANRATLEAFLAHAARLGVIASAPADVAELFTAVEPFVDFTDGL